MTDVETVLRSRLHEQLDDIHPSTLTSARALSSGHRARRRRSIVLAGSAALALFAGGAGAMTALQSQPTHESVIPASGLPTRTVAYAEQLRAGDFASIRADMTPATRAALSESALRSVWHQALATYGDPTGVGSPVVDAGTVTTVRVPLQFSRGTVDLRVAYDDRGDVVGVTLLTSGVEQLPDASQALQETARQVVADLADGRFGRVHARFDARMSAGLPAAALGRAWQQVAVDLHGGFVSTGGLSSTRIAGNTVIDIYCTMQRGDLNVRVSFNDVGRISGLYLLDT
ncbi:MAG: DUF3887 domain-containing protein [Frankiaceae bacterium]|nr:DUF3887 domain-containing protein [Frankiaceae bacterium]